MPATVSYNSASKTATLSPTAALADGTLYTATVNGSDMNGNQLPAPVSWNFRTAYAGQIGGACPCSIFSDLSSPATEIPDTGSVELGVKFSSDADGIITGVRFYKNADNTGIHTGSLWTAGGVLLATATFSNESSSGWQTVTFSSPVAITAGTTYLASYHAPNGHYQATSGAYASTGVDNFPLHVPAHASFYDYATGFPRSASDADYGVDVVFTVPSDVGPVGQLEQPGRQRQQRLDRLGDHRHLQHHADRRLRDRRGDRAEQRRGGRQHHHGQRAQGVHLHPVRGAGHRYPVHGDHHWRPQPGRHRAGGPDQLDVHHPRQRELPVRAVRPDRRAVRAGCR